MSRRVIYACAAAAVISAFLGLSALCAADGGDRSLTIYNVHTKELTKAIFVRGGRFDQAGLDKLSYAMRDHRQNQAVRMDPHLIDLLWQLHTALGSRAPIHLLSGYRSSITNEMLRATISGVASESRHILGKAADVYFPDVPVSLLRSFALVEQRGGVGYYPISSPPFVHVDTDRVRSWPRLSRPMLALLFPMGRSLHTPDDGAPLTAADVKLARGQYPGIARLADQFHAYRIARLSGKPVRSTAGPRPDAKQVGQADRNTPVAIAPGVTTRPNLWRP